MADRSFLDWPFFEPRHRALAEELDAWAGARLAALDHGDTDATCRELVRALGADGWLRHSAVDPDDESAGLDVRSLCLIRETLARHDGLADFAFAMQGLGTGAISLFGSAAQKRNRHRMLGTDLRFAPRRDVRPVGARLQQRIAANVDIPIP